MSTGKDAKSDSESKSKVDDQPSPAQQTVFGDFLGAYKSFSESSANMVQHAANVLESEMSAAIKVAKDVEQRSPMGELLRSEQPDEVVQRFRRDAHEVLDIFVDVFAASLISMKSVHSTSKSVAGSSPEPEPKAETSTPPAGVRSQMMTPQSVKAGGLAEFPISFENSTDVQTDEFKLYSTDLISDSGSRIPSNNIKFIPTSLRIPAHQAGKVTVLIAVPKETTTGVYSGLVLAANMNQLRSEIVIKVE